ncbi:Crp/Fnr family transcriptional regulator [Shinella daejeonensis]|uniref:Crp/Fnr family transcriptional regulator n=1 Tax=Shinella daejeonensis TaxID=659017 RepID=UPI0020C7CBFE|nr:Crp/Fnr family transcriptional regulator [Shinella daejeonensis]MCP8896180.1 Crp/Fnr family transcriptional regulator [Shinella daejeonensis]
MIDRELVDALPIFHGLDASALDKLLAHASQRSHAKGDTVFQQGEEATHFYVLLRGRLKVQQVTADGQQFIVRVVNPGDLFGFAMALGRTQYPGTPIAAVDSVTLAWPMGMMNDILQHNPTFAINTMQMIGQRLDAAHDRLREMSTQEVEGRVAHAVIRLAQEAGVKSGSEIRIDFPISRQDIAEMTGTTLHTVSRIISHWETKGLVKGGRQLLVIADLAGLRRLAGDEAS